MGRHHEFIEANQTELMRQTLPSNVELIEAGPDLQPVLGNLLELYSHDFSEFVDLLPGADGRFGYPRLPLYWQDEKRRPYLVLLEEVPVGVSLIQWGPSVTDGTDTWDVADFFIIRGVRRTGLGTAVAHETWRRNPGKWQVRVRVENLPALPFWRRAVSTFAGGPVESELVRKGDAQWHVFSFISPDENAANPGSASA